MLSQPVTTKIDKPYPYSGSETKKIQTKQKVTPIMKDNKYEK